MFLFDAVKLDQFEPKFSPQAFLSEEQGLRHDVVVA